MTDAPTVLLSGVEVGAELPPLTVRVNRARLIEYAAASGDRNPIHWDEAFAVGVGLPDVIAHGMFTMGAAVEAVSRWSRGRGVIVEYGTKFVAPVVVAHGADVETTVGGTVKKVDEQARRITVELDVRSGGAKVLGRALVVVASI